MKHPKTDNPVYPKKEDVITFLEPFPRYMDDKYIIDVALNDKRHVIRTKCKQHKEIIDELIKTDKKLTGATVKCTDHGEFVVISHSPQEDFFNMVKEGK